GRQQTVWTWTEDTTPPTISGVPAGGNLGCNPGSVPGPDSGASASDGCSGATLSSSVSDTASGCHHTRTITYSAIDGCNNPAAQQQTVWTWTEDTTPPTISGVPAGGNLGCNQGSVPGAASGDSAAGACGGGARTAAVTGTAGGGHPTRA